MRAEEENPSEISEGNKIKGWSSNTQKIKETDSLDNMGVTSRTATPQTYTIMMKDQSTQTTARIVSVAYRLWLPFLINRVLNLIKLRSIIYDQSVDSNRFALWEFISTGQIKRRSWRTIVLKLLLQSWALHTACGYPSWSTECST